MSYIKQTLILKENEKGFSSNSRPFSAIVKIEIEENIATTNLTLINLSFVDSGNFLFVVVDSNNYVHTFPLGSTPLSSTFVFENTPDLSLGFFASIVYDKDKKYVGYNKTSNFPLSFAEAKTIIDNKLFAVNACEKEPLYLDEAVATENYYENSDVDLQNLSIKKDYQEIIIDDKNDKPLIFYETVERELNELFNEYEEEKELMKALPNSKFVKISYSTDKYYVTGIIYNNNKPKYICYGVPSFYQVTPPKSLDGFCSFVPLSVFDTRGKGYYIIFQDASTGKCINFVKNN